MQWVLLGKRGILLRVRPNKLITIAALVAIHHVIFKLRTRMAGEAICFIVFTDGACFFNGSGSANAGPFSGVVDGGPPSD